MGANHFSQTVFGADPDAVRSLLVAWLRAKGFDEQPGEPLAGLDPKHERGLVLAHNDQVVVVLYDTLQEQPRLLYELKKLGLPLLDYWMHDSDIWGYQLWHQGTVADAFHSNPDYFGEHEDIEGPKDVDALCRVLGRPELTDRLRSLQRRRSTFAEDPSTAFVAELGAAAAASQYRYTSEHGWPPEGFEVSRLWFRESGWDPMGAWTVERIGLRVHDPDAWKAHYSPEQVAELEAQAQRTQWLGRAIGLLFTPITWFFRALMWWRMRRISAEAQAAAANPQPPVDRFAQHPPAFSVDGDRLHNPTHHCTLTLPPGATVSDHHRIALGPGSVFRFSLGDLQVVCTAMLPPQAEQSGTLGPPGVRYEERRFKANDRPVRWVDLTWEAPSPTGGEPTPMWRMMAFVAGPSAVYQFATSGQAPQPPDRLAALEATIASLHFA